MKIKLTAEQKAKMEAIFKNMNELSEDKNFMKALKYVENNFDKAANDKNNIEKDVYNLGGFIENIIDSAKCNFNYYNI
ncbi:MAG: hypothetical protein EBR30_01055 [Cytophagia bacterium]|jgi:hypothetical protein|nr:hypothetical protein [Cytophagia bacterium]